MLICARATGPETRATVGWSDKSQRRWELRRLSVEEKFWEQERED
jgi:hypothetical protein